jgi:putative sigma-54 modulation protein
MRLAATPLGLGHGKAATGEAPMQLHVKGKNLEVSDSMRSYVERKLQKLDRRVHELTEVEIELAIERNPSIADSQVAEATVHLKGRTLRARETARDMKAAIDQLADKLTRQVRDLHDKRVGGRRHVAGSVEPAVADPVEAEFTES